MSSRRFRAAPVLERLYKRWPGSVDKPEPLVLATELHELAHHAHLFRCLPCDGEPMYRISGQISEMLDNDHYRPSTRRRLQAEVFACLISEGVAARLGMSRRIMRKLETRVRAVLRRNMDPNEKPLPVHKAVREARARFKDSPTVRRWLEEIYASLVGKST
mgnify:CR=1 FL=1